METMEEANAIRGETDNRNTELVKMIFNLRSHIDIDRIIGLNVPKLKNKNFWGYMQMSTVELLSNCLCKIFEEPSRYDLNSIPSIVKSLPEKSLSKNQKAKIVAFGAKYGNVSELIDAKNYFEKTVISFRKKHSKSFEQLKTWRDKIGAHSEVGAKERIKYLPSNDEFEEMYNFAYDFYVTITSLVDERIHPADPIDFKKVEESFIRLLESLGIEVKSDFDNVK